MKTYLIPSSFSLADREAALELIKEAGGRSTGNLGLTLMVIAPEDLAQSLDLQEMHISPIFVGPELNFNDPR
jgi:hypothetical protein